MEQVTEETGETWLGPLKRLEVVAKQLQVSNGHSEIPIIVKTLQVQLRSQRILRESVWRVETTTPVRVNTLNFEQT